MTQEIKISEIQVIPVKPRGADWICLFCFGREILSQFSGNLYSARWLGL